MKTILGYKVGMTQVWDDKGRLHGATIIFAEPNKILKDGEKTILVQKKPGKLAKPQSVLAKKAGFEINIWTKKTEETDKDAISVKDFNIGETVSISGKTKGKGFAGTIKRHNFHRGPVSHGSNNIRQPGSIGNQQPQHVVKGTRMSGHMGNVNFTLRGNKVVDVIEKENLLIVSGNVPGARKSPVVVKTQ